METLPLCMFETMTPVNHQTLHRLRTSYIPCSTPQTWHMVWYHRSAVCHTRLHMNRGRQRQPSKTHKLCLVVRPNIPRGIPAVGTDSAGPVVTVVTVVREEEYTVQEEAMETLSLCMFATNGPVHHQTLHRLRTSYMNCDRPTPQTWHMVWYHRSALCHTRLHMHRRRQPKTS